MRNHPPEESPGQQEEEEQLPRAGREDPSGRELPEEVEVPPQRGEVAPLPRELEVQRGVLPLALLLLVLLLFAVQHVAGR